MWDETGRILRVPEEGKKRGGRRRRGVSSDACVACPPSHEGETGEGEKRENTEEKKEL